MADVDLSLATDFIVNNAVAEDIFKEEVEADGIITTVINDVRLDSAFPDRVRCVFASALSGPENTQLVALANVHQGKKRPTVLDSFSAIGPLVNIPGTNTTIYLWRDRLRDYIPDVKPAMFFRVRGEVRTTGTGATIDLKRDAGAGTTLGTFAVPDTVGAWQAFVFETTVALTNPSTLYRLLGTLGAATAFDVRGIKISFMRRRG